MPKDTQQKKVYAWGWNLPVQTTKAKCENLAEARKLVEACYAAVPTERTPTITINRRLKAVCRAHYGRRTIELAPGWGLTREVVIHEAAHFAAEYPEGWHNQRSIAGHGPEFMRVNIDMLAAVEGYSTRLLELSAYVMGIKVEGAAKAPAGWPKLKRITAELTKYMNRNPACRPVREIVQMILNKTPLGLIVVFAEGARDEARKLYAERRVRQLQRIIERESFRAEEFRGDASLTRAEWEAEFYRKLAEQAERKLWAAKRELQTLAA